MRHLILVGACYMDTILSVPFFPSEDSKLRATSLTTRRGGNCPNTLQVLQQLLPVSEDGGEDTVRLHLLSTLPAQSSAASRGIASSFGGGRNGDGEEGGKKKKKKKKKTTPVDLSLCLYREDHEQAASSYVLRSEETGSRTLVNYSGLPEMSVDEFKGVAAAFGDGDETWWHFEGRMPETTMRCIRHLRHALPTATVSVEVEKPGRPGLTDLAAEADIVFYSRSWAEDRGHASPESCLSIETHPRTRLALCTWGSEGAAAMSRPRGSDRCYPPWPVSRVNADEVETVVDSVGAGDTFIAGVLYGLLCHDDDGGGGCDYWDERRKLSFAVTLATLKVQQEGFDGLGAAATTADRGMGQQTKQMTHGPATRPSPVGESISQAASQL